MAVASGHAPTHVLFEWVSERLGRATMQLWQTNKEDHEQAKRNKEALAPTFTRSIVLDAEREA